MSNDTAPDGGQEAMLWSDQRIEEALRATQNWNGGLHRYEAENVARRIRDDCLAARQQDKARITELE